MNSSNPKLSLKQESHQEFEHRSQQNPVQTNQDDMMVRSLSLTLPSGRTISEHKHAWGQLVYATSGVMTVVSQSGVWVVPSNRAVWIPPEILHTIMTTGSVRMQTLYFPPHTTSELPNSCKVLEVSPLLRELVIRVIQLGSLDIEKASHVPILELIIGEVQMINVHPLALPMPNDMRALTVVNRVLQNPGERCTLTELAIGSGSSARTIERIFINEIQMTFGRWRQRARLVEALRLLATGETVSTTAYLVGYESVSAFVSMFSGITGSTPGKYFDQQNTIRA